ncbi:MAG: sulfatase-like hydrolase/transferase [Anaerolineales bacterium]|nr:MAG: sulfatase-like hydrolase/transferase [Anaerolineales bacterium]
MSRASILWICTDQQRWDTLGCYGNEYVRTPNLDRLAESGVVFDQCYCQNPVCAPSRASFLTGRYSRTTRCRQNGQGKPEDEVLVTRLLSEGGYNCGLSGKPHLSACHPSVCPASERRIDDGYAEFQWSHDPMDAWPCNEHRHWVRERGAEVPSGNTELSEYVRRGFAAEHHQTTWCAEKVITFMEDCAAFDRPWLFSVNIFSDKCCTIQEREYNGILVQSRPDRSL